MENNKIIPTERIENFNVKKEIEEFKFFLNMQISIL